jgi:hypothetical protein
MINLHLLAGHVQWGLFRENVLIFHINVCSTSVDEVFGDLQMTVPGVITTTTTNTQ